ncbi:MAG TPA: YsnF/AvaK domain-containing protein [Allosphingosinicella sp.]|uniref:YsnF/AvaK domain-containing protein n=1 Tax=Allosphingosinicella sp. TaxID=2823234 RepID=UPI002ED9E051
MNSKEEVAAIPLVEERLNVAKRQVEAGRVRVRISVDEREERIPVELAHDEVEIERVPKNIAVSELPGVRLEGNTTVIPVVEEVVVVEKRLVLVEEIHVRKKAGATTEEIPVTLRSEQAAVERTGSMSVGEER